MSEEYRKTEENAAADYARRYVKAGLAVIPVPAGEKNPNRPEWQKERWTVEDIPRLWTNGAGIGVLWGAPSGGRVDVDCDWPEARAAARYICPPTRTFGRDGAPASHFVLHATDTVPKTKRYKLPGEGDENAVVELLSTGTQSLVPPSLHESGERRRWYHERPTAEVSAGECSAIAADIATTALLVRNWPGVGSRHDYANAATGYIGRNLPRERTERVMYASIEASSDEEAPRRRADVQDTLDKLERKEPATGGPTLEQLAPGIVAQLRRWHGWGGQYGGVGESASGESSPANKKRNQADRLIDYALESGAELFCDQVGAPHVLVNGEALALGSRSYNWLRSLMWDREGISVTGEALKTAAGMLGAFAVKSGRVRELHTRSAWHSEAGAVYYQLRPGRVVQVGRDGWRFADGGEVVFRSVPNLKPLPDPERGGSLDTLEELINLKGARDKRLCKVYAVTLPLAHIPRPIMQTTGLMGSGKTTAGRVIKRLLDPTAPETVRVDPRDFLQKASHSYIVMLDNVNSVPEWAVDVLCRLVTGEADSKRSLYTDDEDFIYEMKRAVLLNGINTPTERGDAQDRTLPVDLERIADNKRRSEEDLWAQFERVHGQLLGAIFDALSKTLKEKETLQLERRPRLADWGEYAAAAYRTLGWGVEAFLEDWEAVVKVQNQGTLEGSSVAQAILSFMESRQTWTGLASDLHAKLEVEAEELNISTKKDKLWPKSPSWLWRRMREVLPLLAAMGIEADNPGNGKNGTQITLTRTPTGDGPGGGPGGGSKNSSATTDATTEHSAEEAASEVGGSRGSKTGHSYTPMSRYREENGGNAGKNYKYTYTGRELPTDATSTTSATTGTKKRTHRGAVEELFADPPDWLRTQVEAYLTRPSGGLLTALCAAVAYQVHDNPRRGEEVRREVEHALERWGR